ncbi:hypothetical protein D3C72_895850 [compost metagenome]
MVAWVLLVGLTAHVRLRQVVLLLGALVYMRSAYVTHRVNLVAHENLPLTPALVTALREDPDHTIVDEVNAASLLSLVLPRQRSTALAYERTYVALADRYVPAYRCVKQRLLVERPGDAALGDAIKILDHAYAYGSQDFPFAHLGRKHAFEVLQDVRAEACEHPDDVPFRYFRVKR